MLQIPVREKLNIHVIGAGGTGGYTVEYLTRLLAGGEHTIHVYDGDQVEAKNLKRQNFTKEELGRNKAVALTERLSQAVFHAPTLIPHEQYLTTADDLMVEILTSLEPDESLILISAVDNIATRKLINGVLLNELVQNRILTIALDCGNDNQGGQVVLYGNAAATWAPMFGKKDKGMLPTMLQIFPELDKIEDVNPGLQRSCEEHAEAEPQAMMANVRNGELLALLVERIRANHKAPGNLWRSDILTGNTTCSFTGFWKGDTA